MVTRANFNMGHHINKWAKLNFVARHYDPYVLGHKGQLYSKSLHGNQYMLIQIKKDIGSINLCRLGVSRHYTLFIQAPQLILGLSVLDAKSSCSG